MWKKVLVVVILVSAVALLFLSCGSKHVEIIYKDKNSYYIEAIGDSKPQEILSVSGDSKGIYVFNTLYVITTGDVLKKEADWVNVLRIDEENAKVVELRGVLVGTGETYWVVGLRDKDDDLPIPTEVAVYRSDGKKVWTTGNDIAKLFMLLVKGKDLIIVERESGSVKAYDLKGGSYEVEIPSDFLKFSNCAIGNGYVLPSGVGTFYASGIDGELCGVMECMASSEEKWTTSMIHVSAQGNKIVVQKEPITATSPAWCVKDGEHLKIVKTPPSLWYVPPWGDYSYVQLFIDGKPYRLKMKPGTRFLGIVGSPFVCSGYRYSSVH